MGVTRAPEDACGGACLPRKPDPRPAGVTACGVIAAHLAPGGRAANACAAGGIFTAGRDRHRNGGRGCQCLQRHLHAERTGREPGARPTVTAGRDQCFGAGSRPSPDPKWRDVTRRHADQSLTAGRDRQPIQTLTAPLLPGGQVAAGVGSCPRRSFLPGVAGWPATATIRPLAPGCREGGALPPCWTLGGGMVRPPPFRKGVAPWM